jgi:hypothetical protein
MCNYLTKLNICDAITAVGETLEGKTPLCDVFKQWGIVEGSGTDLKSLLLSLDETSLDIREQPIAINGDYFRLFKLDHSVKEVLMSLLWKTFPNERSSISQAMKVHVYTSSKMYRDFGRPDVAKQSLSRLRALLTIFEDTTPIIPLALRLEDAKVMACQSDFGNAIIHCKTIVNYLTDNETADVDHSSLLARSLLLGGCLMAHEHVDAVGVMESFFDRAAKLSDEAHKAHSHPSGLIPAVAYFKLGEFASSIYTSVDVRSDAVKQRKANLMEREKEVNDLKTECAQLEKKVKKSRKQADIDAYQTMNQKYTILVKEVDLERREIKSNEEGLQKYLGLAIESYCSALKLCPTTATSIDYAKHVFKLIGLWFKNCSRSDTEMLVRNLMQQNISQIPTYHFVPLIYQIFSRIDNVDCSFQDTLWKLVISICTEHPYHAIPQLLALSNGNLSNKVEAANR